MSDKVVQFSDKRQEKQEAIRREYERFLFHRFLGCYTVLEKVGLKSAEVLDISRNGCLFRTPYEDGCYNVGEDIDFRFYFTNKNYVPVRFKVQRVEKVDDNGIAYWSYGCSFDKELSTYSTLEKFVEFIEAFALSAKEDVGTPRNPGFGL